MSQYCIIGHRGFIGGALARYIGEYTTYPTEDTKYIFFMGGVVHPMFEKNPEYFSDKEVNEIKHLAAFCLMKRIKLIYCSSALVIEGKKNKFTEHKKTIEKIAGESNLGLRIFPVYGPGDHDTVISQWCRAIKNKEKIEVYGNGNQTRDFIYVHDVAEQIFLSKNETGIKEIGVGNLYSFNAIIQMISAILNLPAKVEYVEAPKGYQIEGVKCSTPIIPKVNIMQGIRIICESL